MCVTMHEQTQRVQEPHEASQGHARTCANVDQRVIGHISHDMTYLGFQKPVRTCMPIGAVRGPCLERGHYRYRYVQSHLQVDVLLCPLHASRTDSAIQLPYRLRRVRWCEQYVRCTWGRHCHMMRWA